MAGALEGFWTRQLTTRYHHRASRGCFFINLVELALDHACAPRRINKDVRCPAPTHDSRAAFRLL